MNSAAESGNEREREMPGGGGQLKFAAVTTNEPIGVSVFNTSENDRADLLLAMHQS